MSDTLIEQFVMIGLIVFMTALIVQAVEELENGDQ